MKNNTLGEFFIFTVKKLVFTLIIGFIFFLISFSCSGLYFTGGLPIYPCGNLIALVSNLPYKSTVMKFVYLALFYFISCSIIYIWRNIKNE